MKSFGQDAWAKSTETDIDEALAEHVAFLLPPRYTIPREPSVFHSGQRHPQQGRLCGRSQGPAATKEWTWNSHLSRGLRRAHFPNYLLVLSVF